MLIANARMYSPAPGASAAWRDLFQWLAHASDLALTPLEHPASAPLAELWRRPDLGCCFMCGWPLAKQLAPVTPLAAPVMNDPLTQARPVYWTDFVVRFNSDFKRLEDTFLKRIAYTAKTLHAGYNAVRHHLSGLRGGRRGPLFSEVVGPLATSRAAALAVLEGRADVAPLDAYVHLLLRRYEPDLALGLRVIARGEPAPMPPLVAAATLDPRKRGRLTDALIGAALDPQARAILARLELKSFAPADAARYDLTLAWEREAKERGYPEIA